MGGETADKAVNAEQILEVDNAIDNLIDSRYRDDLSAVLNDALDLLANTVSCNALFVSFDAPRTFTGEDWRRLLVYSKDTPEALKNSLAELADRYRNTEIRDLGENVTPLQDSLGRECHVLAVPMFAGIDRDYVGILGASADSPPGDSVTRLLKQAASRLDTHIQGKTMSTERHTALNLINKLLQKKGISGIGEALRVLVELTGVEKGVVIYLEDAVDPAVLATDRRVGLYYVDQGVIADKPDIHSKLNHGLGGPMIAYDTERIDDSEYGMRVMEILRPNPETGVEEKLDFHCKDLVDRHAEAPEHIGKLFLIGDRPLDPTDLNVMEAVSLQFETLISHYHEQKKALGRSLHPEQVEFFIRHPRVAKWFFENPQEETIAMVFSDICGYTAITRELGDPRKTIEGARSWIRTEKELTLKHGGFFDKEVGDCAVSLFGPPFGAISLDALSRVKSVDDIRELIRTRRTEPHVYAFHAVLYALESMETVKSYRLGDRLLNLSVGIEVGNVAIGDLTGDIGKLTAMGDPMNLASRLQSLAEDGQIVVGPQCARYLEKYRREAYLTELPFTVVEIGEAIPKGYAEPVPYYEIRWKSLPLSNE